MLRNIYIYVILFLNLAFCLASLNDFSDCAYVMGLQKSMNITRINFLIALNNYFNFPNLPYKQLTDLPIPGEQLDLTIFNLDSQTLHSKIVYQAPEIQARKVKNLQCTRKQRDFV